MLVSASSSEATPKPKNANLLNKSRQRLAQRVVRAGEAGVVVLARAAADAPVLCNLQHIKVERRDLCPARLDGLHGARAEGDGRCPSGAAVLCIWGMSGSG